MGKGGESAEWKKGMFRTLVERFKIRRVYYKSPSIIQKPLNSGFLNGSRGCAPCGVVGQSPMVLVP